MSLNEQLRPHITTKTIKENKKAIYNIDLGDSSFFL